MLIIIIGTISQKEFQLLWTKVNVIICFTYNYLDFVIHIIIHTIIFVSGRDDEDSKDSWLFTGALYNGYGPPKGFCFDQ